MPVVTANEVRRRAVPSPNLDDLGALVGRTDDPAADVQPVTHYRAHGNSSQGCSPAASTFLLGSGRGSCARVPVAIDAPAHNTLGGACDSRKPVVRPVRSLGVSSRPARRPLMP